MIHNMCFKASEQQREAYAGVQGISEICHTGNSNMETKSSLIIGIKDTIEKI